MKSQEVVLARRIEAKPQLEDFAVIEREVTDPADDQLLVRNHYLSLDPYIGQALYGRHMGESHPEAGDPLPGHSVATVLASKSDRFAAGDMIVAKSGWAQFGTVSADEARKVDASLGTAIHLGLLGIPGLTAWAGIVQLAQVKAGDVVSVDAAAGSVGGAVGQLARIAGARAVGIAGGPDKCNVATQTYGFDACIDYRSEDWEAQYAAEVDGGATVHFENVGLSILTPAFANLRDYARVVLCGLAEHYHDAGAARPSLAIGNIMLKRASVMGLIVYDFIPRFDEWIAYARDHVLAGRLVEQQDIAEGLSAAPDQLQRLLAGKNAGKTLVRIDPDAVA